MINFLKKKLKVKMRKIIVDEKLNGKSLNHVLSFCFPALKQNMFFKALRQKDIKVNGTRVKENVAVNSGDVVEVYIADSFLLGETVDLKVIFEDENILAIDKPAGISVTDEAGTTSTCLSKVVQEKFGKDCRPCHRLDRNTKGLVLFAKNQEAETILVEKFKNHEIEKHYQAQVFGIPKEENQVLRDYLFKDSKKNLVYISSVPKKGYQEIITEYTVISKDEKNNTSLLDVNLHTGRTHQIRAHLAFYRISNYW
ncbi:MAG: RluA family pseudouridine synthase [Clostridia bacterium]|nr:RluA family pseudouridine synthase [Clostridia bacterium]